MNIWIDNTGLQSAAQCLEGRANPNQDYDVRGLLQLATLIIYGNNISLNGFEDDIIARRSQEIIEQLQTIHISEDILSINPVSEDEYALACKTTADSIAPELCYSFNPDEYQLIGGEPPDLPIGLHERQVKCIELASEPENSAKLKDVEKNALRDKAIGAVEYMLACSPALREAVGQMIKVYPNWGDRHSYQLNVFLRYHLNDILGEQNFSKYAPAIGRARLINRRNHYVLESIGDTIDEIVTELRGEHLGVPSTLAALLQRSKGEPKAVLEVAREFREHSKPLRDCLHLLYEKYPDDTPESRFGIRKKINELGRQLRRDVGLEKNAKLRDAIEVRFVIGFPVPFVSGKELLKWLKERKQSKRTAVLTELVKASAYSDLSSDLFEKLRKLSTREN